MRESFVFHSEYIEDLPDEHKATFAMYTINYALNNESPKIAENTLEWALWIKIAKRIDQEREKYESIKAKRAEAGKKHKGNQYKQELSKEETLRTKPYIKKEEPIEKPTKKPKEQTFEKPTIEEIQEYCTERKNNIDAQAFFNFYESKGWKIGMTKMKDWKASVRTWEQRQKNESTQKKVTGALWGQEDDIPDEIIDTF